MRNFEAAERAFQAAIDLESDNSVALLELAQVQVAQGEHLRAADTFERAVKVCLLSIASLQNGPARCACSRVQTKPWCR